MEIFKPLDNGFTIYSKSGCINCTKVKKFLLEKHIFFVDVQCDDNIIENKENFLLYMKELAGREVKTFPIIFNNGEFIGGFIETVEVINKNISFNENDF